MKKRLLSFLLVCCMVVTMLPLSVFAADVVASGYCGADGNEESITWMLTGDGVLSFDGSGDMTDYNYADDSPWYNYKSMIKNIVINGNIDTIGSCAFYDYDNLLTITAGSLIRIGNYAFYDCDNLTSAEVLGSPSSDGLTGIGKAAFAECDNLKTVKIYDAPSGDSGRSWLIDAEAFSNCVNLTEFIISNDYTTAILGYSEIGEYAFNNCVSLTKIDISSSVNKLGDYAFYNCMNLREVYFWGPNTGYYDDEIGDYVFGWREGSWGEGVFALENDSNYLEYNPNVTFYYTKGAAGWPNEEVKYWVGPDWITYDGNMLKMFDPIGMDNPSDSNEIANYTNFGQYNGSTRNYVTDPSTGSSKDLMETVTINGIKYNVADTCEQEPLYLPTDYLGNYYYIAYNLNENNEVSEAKIMPGTVCKLEGWDAVNKIVDTDYEPPITGDDRTLPSGSYHVSDVTASSLPSDEIGDWVGDQVRIYCVGEQIFKVIHITDGEGEVTAYDKNLTPNAVLIDGRSYPVANDGILRATIASPFDNNSEYIKDAEFTMYDGTIVELTYINERLDPASFNEPIYRADSLTSGINSIYSLKPFNDALLNNGYSVSSILVDSLGWGMQGLSFAWETITDVMDTVQSGPSNLTDFALEQKDMMGAYILQALKINTEIGIIDEYKTATKDISEILGLSTDIIKNYTEQTEDFTTFAKKNEGKFKDTMLQYYREKDPKVADLIASDKGMGILNAVLNTADGIESLYEQYIGYLKLYNLTESTRNAVNQMYESCPSSKWDIKLALGEILPVINAATEQQFKNIMTGNLIISAEYSAVKLVVDKWWDGIFDNLSTKHPVMAMVFAIYNAGEYAIDQLFGTDATVEQYYKLRAIMELEDVANTSVAAIAQKYKNNSSELNASTLLDMIEIKFGLLDLDFDEAIKYSEIVHDEGAIRGFINSIKDFIGSDTSNELKETIEAFVETKDEVHFEVLTNWINELSGDYPSLLPYFREFWAEMWVKYRGNDNVYYLDGMFTEEELQAGFDKLIDMAKDLFEHISVACPVNVYVYDSANNLVASVEDGIVKSSDNIAIIVEDEIKNFYFFDDQQYYIVCEGYDAGEMTVVLRNYDVDGNIQRLTNYNNITVTAGSEHIINIDIKNQEILEPVLKDDRNNTILPDYDSARLTGNTGNVEVMNGYISDGDNICFERTGYAGEIVSITAVVPDGYVFTGWTSSNSEVKFENMNDISTNFIMVNDDVVINAILTPVSSTYTITFDGNGGYTTQTTVTTNIDWQISILPNAVRDGYIFDGWYTDPVNGTKVTTTTVFTSDTTVYAHWTKETKSGFDEDYWYWALMMLYNQEFDITASATEGGTITPAGISKVKYDKNITYTITPDEGYAIADVLVDGKSVGAVSEYTIKRIKENHTISAIFFKTAWENPYTDVSSEAWYYEDVEFVSENGLMIGVESNKFAPDSALTRGMIVTVLWRLEGSPDVDFDMQFEDVEADAWYTEAIRWAAANGIVNGYGDGKFGPENDVTREQAAAILQRYAVYKGWDDGITLPMIPQYTYSAWAENSIIWADMNGLLDDIGEDTSDMTVAANRAEIAAYLRRFCENIAE